jgi:hypothetical protein
MAAVAIVALELAAIRSIDPLTPRSSVLGFGTLSMANALGLGLLMGRLRRGSEEFLSGFEAFGVMALLAYTVVAIKFPYQVIKYIHYGTRPYEEAVAGSPFVTLHHVIAYAIGTAMLFLPQVAFALLGGFLSRTLSAAKWRDQAHRR